MVFEMIPNLLAYWMDMGLLKLKEFCFCFEQLVWVEHFLVAFYRNWKPIYVKRKKIKSIAPFLVSELCNFPKRPKFSFHSELLESLKLAVQRPHTFKLWISTNQELKKHASSKGLLFVAKLKKLEKPAIALDLWRLTMTVDDLSSLVEMYGAWQPSRVEKTWLPCYDLSRIRIQEYVFNGRSLFQKNRLYTFPGLPPYKKDENHR